MPARVLVIGLDAAESTLLERWSAEGRLPGIAALTAGGAVWRLDNPLETLPGAVWPEIETGRSCRRMAHYFHPDQIRTGEGRLRPVRPEEIEPVMMPRVIGSRSRPASVGVAPLTIWR